VRYSTVARQKFCPTTVPVREATRVAQRLTNTKIPDNPPTSARDNSTTMAPIDNAIAAIELLEPGEHYSYREVACRFTVLYTTLTRRHKGRQEPREAKDTSQLALSPQQEAELVRYIEDLTKRALPPTRAIIKNFASHFNPDSMSEAWVNCFVRQHGDHLVSKWTSGIDSQCHNANSRAKYKLYFDHLHSKML
jgi:hypothetical protein